jgi:hypothetical protein
MTTHSPGRLFLILATFLSIGLGVIQQLSAAENPRVLQTNGPATLLVSAPANKDQIALGLADVLPITLEVQGGKGLEVKPPDKITLSPGWRLVEASPARIVKDGEKTRWQQAYTFEPLAPGDLTLSIEPLQVRNGGGAFRSLAWKPLSIQVSSSVASPTLNNLRDPTTIEQLPPVTESETVPWLWISAAIVVTLLIVVICYRRLHRARPRVSLPGRRAQRELERLLALNLHNKGMTEKFHTLLTKILRRYLDACMEIPARRRTTRELLELLQSSSKLTDPERAFLREFFERCDLVKFARAEVSPEECAELAEKTRGFIKGHVDATSG